jgi:hypothetical protein
VIQYEVEVDGAVLSTVSAEPDGSIRYDMVGTTDGDHSIRVRARNSWDWGPFSDPLAFTAGAPTAPAALELSIN